MRKLVSLVVVLFAFGCGDLVVKNPGDGDFDNANNVDRANNQVANNNTVTPGNNSTTNPPPNSNNNTTIPPDNNANNTDPPPLMCTSPEMLCGDACLNVTNDNNNCGACNNACPGGSSCVASDCVCDGGGELCDGACVDTTNSNAHCGACNNPCGGGMICLNSACVENTEVAAVLQATNMHRSTPTDCGQYGVLPAVPPLQGDENLHIAAQVHADDMATNNFFSHTGSDGSSFSQRIARTAFQGSPVGENIAGGGNEAAGVVQRWVDSDGHCRNLMSSRATKLGVGFQRGGQYGTMWVQVFGN